MAFEDIVLLISSTCALASVYIAFRTVLIAKSNSQIAFKAFEENRIERKMSLHNQFQTSIRDIQKSLPASVNDENYSPSAEEKRLISIYWYAIFDEWYVCKKSENSFDDLWDNFYSSGIKSAFRIEAFKERIEEMFSKGESSFMGFGMEFKEVLNEICFEATKKQLK